METKDVFKRVVGVLLDAGVDSGAVTEAATEMVRAFRAGWDADTEYELARYFRSNRAVLDAFEACGVRLTPDQYPRLSDALLALYHRIDREADPGPWLLREGCLQVTGGPTGRVEYDISALSRVNQLMLASARGAVHELLMEVERLRAKLAERGIHE